MFSWDRRYCPTMVQSGRVKESDAIFFLFFVSTYLLIFDFICEPKLLLWLLFFITIIFINISLKAVVVDLAE